MRMIRTIGVLLLCLCLAAAVCAAEEQDYYTEMPEYLRVTQETVTEQLHDNVRLIRVYPQTPNTAVNAEITELVDGWAEEFLEELPDRNQTVITDLDVGSVFSRTGTKWVSFLTEARLAVDNESRLLRAEARVYDTETGEQIRLTDIFPEDSPVWESLPDTVRAELIAWYPQESAEPEILDHFCDPEYLKNVEFIMRPTRIALVFPAETLYPGHETLMFVYLSYSDYRPLMTETAFEQTDNSRFRMTALTYDDGPAKGVTKRLLNCFREYGQSATFFVVGLKAKGQPGLIRRENDEMFSVASHSWRHEFPQDYPVGKMIEDNTLFAETLEKIIGKAPSLLRAPGGYSLVLAKRRMGYPLIHWSVISKDADAEQPDPIYIAIKVYDSASANDGEIILMHDINSNSPYYSKTALEELCNRGVLCVTVEELFERAGIPLEADHVYYSTSREIQNWETPLGNE